MERAGEVFGSVRSTWEKLTECELLWLSLQRMSLGFLGERVLNLASTSENYEDRL